jgi:hypothetical protein
MVQDEQFRMKETSVQQPLDYHQMDKELKNLQEQEN